MSETILIVDDEPDTLELVEYNLRGYGYQVLKAADGEEALAQVRRRSPNLIVLDVMLPGLSGREVCKILRQNPATASVPILMLTAKADEIDRILGLELGADDYVTKPFSPRELVLRIRGLLQRSAPTPAAQAERIHTHNLVIDLPRHAVWVENERVELTATEFKLLTLLAQREGRVQSREKLLQEVWGYESLIDTRTVDTHIRRVREKLGSAAQFVETVRGVGYRFVTEPEPGL